MDKPKLNQYGSDSAVYSSDNNISKTDAIKQFLLQNTREDLATLYTPEMECQVIVSRGDGRQIQKDYKGSAYNTYVNSAGENWKSFRIPFDAGNDPKYTESPMTFSLEKHALGIGMTGWNWKQRKSIFVAFDFDSVIGHTVGLTDNQLYDIRKKACAIDWVTVRTSTSGSGLHLYIFVDNVETQNHHEHAALARSVLSKMSALTGYDFQSVVDTCGGNMWCWHRKMFDADNKICGLEIVKQGTVLTDIPPNWQAHIKVTRNRKAKIDIGIPSGDDFENVLNERNLVPLDEDHIALIQHLEGSGSWWDSDHHLLVTHSALLKKAHTELKLKGIYETVAVGREADNDRNCFAIPRKNGSWIVRRYGNIVECPPWFLDNWGYTSCFFNRNPDFNVLTKSHGGIETEKRGYLFSKVDSALEIFKSLGIDPPDIKKVDRETTLKEDATGRIILKIGRNSTDTSSDFPGFEPNKDKTWTKVFYSPKKETEEIEISKYDTICRHLITPNLVEAGWVLMTDAGFIKEKPENVRLGLKAKGFTSKEIERITGSSILCPWTMVCRPFEDEYPGNRQWNLNAPQFTFPLNEDYDALQYPTWLKILEHLGSTLDPCVEQSQWCRDNGIENGASYLKCWCASLFQFPLEPLPYLFFVGPQNSGKSILHEALSMLFSPGYINGDTAITSSGTFNGELQNAVLCYIEETDLSTSSQAYNRIKEWVTATHILIHYKHQTPFMIPNTTHWIQCANDVRFCPIFPGDTRIVMIDVKSLDPKTVIPKSKLLDMLREEASDFLTALMRMDIPKSSDRLNIPPIFTEAKKSLELENRDDVRLFIDEHCYVAPGHFVRVDQLYELFLSTLHPKELTKWGKVRFGQAFQAQSSALRGRHFDGTHIWANITVTPPSPDIDYTHRFARRLDRETDVLCLEEI